MNACGIMGTVVSAASVRDFTLNVKIPVQINILYKKLNRTIQIMMENILKVECEKLDPPPPPPQHGFDVLGVLNWITFFFIHHYISLFLYTLVML